ncbi:hypothetical protein AOLI_G00130310 [Acnodon oligacanthus]
MTGVTNMVPWVTRGPNGRPGAHGPVLKIAHYSATYRVTVNDARHYNPPSRQSRCVCRYRGALINDQICSANFRHENHWLLSSTTRLEAAEYSASSGTRPHALKGGYKQRKCSSGLHGHTELKRRLNRVLFRLTIYTYTFPPGARQQPLRGAVTGKRLSKKRGHVDALLRGSERSEQGAEHRAPLASSPPAGLEHGMRHPNAEPAPPCRLLHCACWRTGLGGITSAGGASHAGGEPSTAVMVAGAPCSPAGLGPGPVRSTKASARLYYWRTGGKGGRIPPRQTDGAWVRSHGEAKWPSNRVKAAQNSRGSLNGPTPRRAPGASQSQLMLISHLAELL